MISLSSSKSLFGGDGFIITHRDPCICFLHYLSKLWKEACFDNNLLVTTMTPSSYVRSDYNYSLFIFLQGFLWVLALLRDAYELNKPYYWYLFPYLLSNAAPKGGAGDVWGVDSRQNVLLLKFWGEWPPDECRLFKVETREKNWIWKSD